MREKKEKVLSRIHVSNAETFSIIFPFNLKGELRYVLVMHGNKRIGELQNNIETTSVMDHKIYLLQINNNFILTFHPLLLQLLSGFFLAECNTDESVFFEKILRKLDQQYKKGKNNLISRFYLSIFLHCLNEILIRGKPFMCREEILARDFLKILQTENNSIRRVQYYANKLFVSRRYLTKAVSNTFGRTPKELITIRVVDEAKKLLKTQLSIYEISEHLKFESSASFTVFFKKHTQCTPSEYRQKIQDS
ncbi:helix-turn-helix domain-containing protein [Flavobacterium aquiphilum]|uniref:helix-turn-helix domain-containing protein n=1 Tax=Flavobacterium aquiphilum TaxID=3003261 RepID=UPI00247FEB44|nr:helix-turn-helix domain-containing protein [Flavobacterium aquiphilum]